jgi:hypothetical protein
MAAATEARVAATVAVEIVATVAEALHHHPIPVCHNSARQEGCNIQYPKAPSTGLTLVRSQPVPAARQRRRRSGKSS